MKGIALLGIASSVREVLGEEAFQRTLAHLSDPVASALRYGTIVPSSWIPLSWHLALHDAVLSATRSGPTIFRRVAKHTTVQQLRGVYRVFVRIAGPEAVIARAGVILGTYYSHSAVAVLERHPGFCSTRFHGCTGFTTALWENICGACEGALEASGATSIRVRMTPPDSGAPEEMNIQARWV